MRCWGGAYTLAPVLSASPNQPFRALSFMSCSFLYTHGPGLRISTLHLPRLHARPWFSWTAERGLSSINFVYPLLHPISYHAGLPSSCIQQRALEGEMPSSSQRVCAEQGSGIQLRQRRLLLDFLTVHLESADA